MVFECKQFAKVHFLGLHSVLEHLEATHTVESFTNILFLIKLKRPLLRTIEVRRHLVHGECVVSAVAFDIDISHGLRLFLDTHVVHDVLHAGTLRLVLIHHLLHYESPLLR